jgi:hypothetical protein
MVKKLLCVLMIVTCLEIPIAALACSPNSGEYVKLRNVNSGLYLAISGSKIDQGANVIQWADRDQDDIEWRLIATKANWFKLKNRWSGLFLAVSGSKIEQGANVIQWSDRNQRDIEWLFESSVRNSCKLKNF